jgi:hypothetical protein
LADWLQAEGVAHLVMESTGVFWQPIYNLLEATGVEVLVANAHHVRGLPGRKTDVQDAEWLADLVRHGLVRGSVILSRGGRELREVVRARTGLIRQRAQIIDRLQKVLEGANVKLSAVVSEVVGTSGRAMLEALVRGNFSPGGLSSRPRRLATAGTMCGAADSSSTRNATSRLSNRSPLLLARSRATSSPVAPWHTTW